MKQPIRPFIITVTLCWSLAAFAAGTTTYKWVDESGNVHYSQRPPPNSNYEKMKVKTPSSSGDTEAPASTGQGQEAGSNSDSGDVVASEVAKNQEIRKQNCEAAKKNLQAYTIYKRVQKPDGTVVRLDDEERAKLIEESKAAIKEFCD